MGNFMRIFTFILTLKVAISFTSTHPHKPSSSNAGPDKGVGLFSSVQLSSGKVFLLGGAVSDTSADIYKALKESTGKESPRIAVVISAAPSLAVGLEAYYEPDETSTSYQQLFTDYGFQPSVVLLAQDNYEQGANGSKVLGAQNIALVESADVVFFNGGDQSRHSRSWFNDDGSDSDILRALRARFASDDVVIAGTSAGLAIQSNPTFGEGRSYGYYYFDADLKPCQIGETLVDDRQGSEGFRAEENGGYMKGLEFVKDALTDSHFDARGRFARLVVAMNATNKQFGIGVDEDTAAYINQNAVTVYGQYGVWIVDSTEVTYPNDNSHFEATNVKVHYLSSGDSYDAATKQVITSKTRVSVSEGEVYESDDIFYTDEALKSIISLAASSQRQSVGYSYEAKPTARIVFRKENETLFYYAEDVDLYTIDSLRMDIGTLEEAKLT